MKKRIILCYLFAGVFLTTSIAQTADSLTRQPAATDSLPGKPRLWNNPFYRMGHIAVPMIAIGCITSSGDQVFKAMRNSYAPRFRSHYDDYLQYMPGALMLGLKVAGVEGRSSWGRMLVSDAFAAGIMALTVNTIKTSVSKERPDHSGNNSFPSGHTATAFMFATMLHKEYGVTRSPLYSVAGYTMATATALSRQLNNKHWFSDVLTGAGIGILSTELGYYLADLIFKQKGLVRPALTQTPDYDHYAYLGLQMGYGIGEREVHLPHGIEIEGMGGVTSAINTGWFFNRHWGMGAKFSISQVTPQLSDTYFDTHPEMKPLITNVETRSMTYTTLTAGLLFDQKIIHGLHVGGSLMPGIGWAESYRINVQYKNDDTVRPLIECNSKPMANLDLSVYLLHALDKNLGFRIFVNYNMGKGNGEYRYYAPEGTQIKVQSGRNSFQLHNFNIGMEVDALLWR